MRIRLTQIILSSGLGTSVHRGMGGVVNEKDERSGTATARIWYENGIVWVKPLVNTGNGVRMRMYHPSSCEMYPYEEDAPAMPEMLKAVGGGKK